MEEVIQMKKINVILDETTILNFPFLWTLILRYRTLSLTIPSVIFFVATVMYLAQYEISSVHVGFKYIGTESDSPTTAIVQMLGEKTAQLKPEEIIAIPNSPDFRFRLAQELVKNPDFNMLNFNSMRAKDLKTNDEIFSSCKGDQDCIAHRLTSLLTEFYYIENDKQVDTKFYLHVRTLDAHTSNVLIGLVSRLMAQVRIDSIKHFLSAQIKLSEELLSNKKHELKNTDVSAIKDKKELLELKLIEMNKKHDAMSQAIEQRKMALSRQEITHKQTQVEISKGQYTDERTRLENIAVLKNRIQEIQNDISALELNKDRFSTQDNMIINELKKELRNKKSELAKNGGEVNERSISSEDQFLKRTDSESGFTEFNFKILQKEYDKLKIDFQALTKERDALSQERIAINNQLEELRPSYEYAKMLDTKIMQLKLVEGTVVTDLSFEHKISSINKFKKVTKVKTFFFAFALASLATLSLLVLRYLIDNRIYDEYELKKNFEDLEIIGNTPNFN